MLTFVIWVVSSQVFVKLALYICVSLLFSQIKKTHNNFTLQTLGGHMLNL